MATVDEQHGQVSKVDPALVHQVINATRDVNHNLGSVLHQTGKLLLRQNILIALCTVLASLLALQLFQGHSIQRLQQASRAQLYNVEQTRASMTEEIEEVRKFLQGMKNDIPTVKSGGGGKLDLELSVDGGSAASTEKVVIPLKPAQSKVVK